MSDGLMFYTIDDDFINDLQTNVDSRVFSNIDPKYEFPRKYLGVVLSINGFLYYAPLSSPKATDYKTIDGKSMIRNSILPIIRMTESDAAGNRFLLGTIKLSNMLPVPEDKLIDYDLDNEPDVDYKNLVLKEKRFINRNEEMIVSFAEQLYLEKTGGESDKGYLKATFDFLKFEKYIKGKYMLKT